MKMILTTYTCTCTCKLSALQYIMLLNAHTQLISQPVLCRCTLMVHLRMTVWTQALALVPEHGLLQHMYMYTYVHVSVCYVLVHERSVIETRQCKAAAPEDNSLFLKRKRRAASGGIRTCDILCTRQTLYQLSHRGSSAGQAKSLNVM